MKMKSERTFTLGEGDIKAIVAEHLSRTQGVECTAEMIVVRIQDSIAYSGQFGEKDTPAVLTVTAVIDETGITR